ncbi:hypothetical protein [Kineococcus glutinatus]|uniref:Uncharacterized protein n=1 Tax=Kineococcus glutinatus TaxID=1070872 RepID=A0ABP9HK75_9ACTN
MNTATAGVVEQTHAVDPHSPAWLARHLVAAWTLAAMAPDVPVTAITVCSYEYDAADSVLSYTLRSWAEAEALCSAWDVPAPAEVEMVNGTAILHRCTTYGAVTLAWQEESPNAR